MCPVMLPVYHHGCDVAADSVCKTDLSLNLINPVITAVLILWGD